MSKRKISMIGGGQIGGTLASIFAEKCYDVVLLDRKHDVAKGKALDIVQSLAIDGIDAKVKGTSNYEEISGSDVVIVTAGMARKPGMSRDDLLNINTEVMATVGKNIATYTPNAFVIAVTNPLDAMVYALMHYSGLHHTKVVGMAGVLDSGRFVHFLSDKLGVSARDIVTMVLGGHGDTMVPLLNCTFVSGVPLSDVLRNAGIERKELDSIVERTRNGGAEIVQLLQTGSAYYAPARAAAAMADAYLNDTKRLLPCAAYLQGEYGVDGLYVGVPVIIGASGVEKVVTTDLSPDEKIMFDKSVAAVRDLVNALNLTL